MKLRKVLTSLMLLVVCPVVFHVFDLNAQETGASAGKKLFVQRCSVCHLPPLGVRTDPPYARKLTGYMRGPESEARAREVIRKGTAGTPGMPGFQYTLEPEQIDDIIAYLKTLK